MILSDLVYGLNHNYLFRKVNFVLPHHIITSKRNIKIIQNRKQGENRADNAKTALATSIS